MYDIESLLANIWIRRLNSYTSEGLFQYFEWQNPIFAENYESGMDTTMIYSLQAI